MFAVRWIVTLKPLVDNMLSASHCYSSLNRINVARRSGETVCLYIRFVCFYMVSASVRAHPSPVAVGGHFICRFVENWNSGRTLELWAAAACDWPATKNTLFTFAPHYSSTTRASGQILYSAHCPHNGVLLQQRHGYQCLLHINTWLS